MSALSSAALDATTRPLPSTTRRDSASSSSSDPIAYAEEDEQPAVRTTKQKVDRRPVSTFYRKPWHQMTFNEFICNLATCPPSIHELKDESINRGPVPSQSLIKENIFILARAFTPILAQSASYYFFPDFKWPLALAYPVYFLTIIHFAISVVARLNHYCVELGTLDEKNIGRDRTPDQSVDNLAKGSWVFMLFRTALPFINGYDASVNPLTSFSWTFPLRLALWEITLDYFFYVYHRSSHQIDALWWIHQHHHTTKHPTAILAILAEDFQECLEIAIVPSLATYLIPMTFSETFVVMCYTLYVEMLGHSGVRSYWSHPVLTPILGPFNCELAVEDHDLHHRFGKSGLNFGKQTRLWDQVFGTAAERIETYGF